MVWPLEAQTIREFAEGLEEILVVEEKRQFIEYQFKEELFSWIGTGKRVPRVIGKFDEKDGGEWAVPQGNWILPAHYEFSPSIVAKAIAMRIGKLELPADVRARMAARIAIIEAKERALAKPRLTIERKPFFCSGCPHNTSTVVPEGSRAAAGIGCHYMVIWQDRSTSTFTQMGGEGVPWIGQQPFTDTKHIFANLGDGTYFHSGYLAIRAAVAANVPITYKILFNDAVAMTGGQVVDGQLTVPKITQQVAAEGVQKIVVVTDEPEKYDAKRELDHSAVNARGATGHAWDLADGVTVHHRDELDRIQKELREYPGVSVLVYDQTCASEKRRRRKQNKADKIVFPDPPRRTVINELVCEGCGDCSVQSNCIAVEPLETEFGRKRQINQSSCNKDFSCLKGFCPSFVTVENAQLRKAKGASGAMKLPDLPQPTLPELPVGRNYGVVITGVGGTGVVTIGQLMGMAAHLEGKGLSALDQAGLAQKGGAVFSHVQIARTPEDLFATRIAMGEADVVLGCDLIVTASNEALSKIHAGRTTAVVNTNESPTAEFVRNPNWQYGAPAQIQQVRDAVGDDEHVSFIDAQGLATKLLGDAIYTNPFMLGFAWQRGWVPLAYETLMRAIELNGVAIDANKRAFEWGRAAAHDVEAGQAHRQPGCAGGGTQACLDPGRDARQARRVPDRLPGRRLREALQRAGRARAQGRERPPAVDEAHRGGRALLLQAAGLQGRVRSRTPAKRPGVPRQDRVAVRGGRRQGLRTQLLPRPTAAREDRPGNRRAEENALRPVDDDRLHAAGEAQGPARHRVRHLRQDRERRTERALIGEYEQLVDELLSRLAADNHAVAVQLASIPEEIRGYGHVKERNLQQARTKWADLLATFRGQQKAQVIQMPARAA